LQALVGTSERELRDLDAATQQFCLALHPLPPHRDADFLSTTQGFLVFFRSSELWDAQNGAP
jgi:hypothetical protein